MDTIKWIFTFALLLVTLAWGIFCVVVVYNALQAPIEGTDVLSVAGVSAFMGALIGWNSLTIQFWFRKAKAIDSSDSSDTETTETSSDDTPARLKK